MVGLLGIWRNPTIFTQPYASGNHCPKKSTISYLRTSLGKSYSMVNRCKDWFILSPFFNCSFY